MFVTRLSAVHQANLWLDRSAPYGKGQQSILNSQAFEQARREITGWPGYRPTPLVSLPGLAARLGLAEVLYKDEGKRFHLKSFKALGGAYAVLCLLKEHLARQGLSEVSSGELIAGRHRDLVRDVTVATATDGNHGRSVAWGAQMFGCRCIIYLHEHVSSTREAEIAAFGAEIRRVPGSYDHSVLQCARDAVAYGWFLVADTSLGGDGRVPSMVMQGYTLLVHELMQALDFGRISHVFVPGAVGGIAAAIVGHLWERFGTARPRTVVVEPMKADCISRSIAAGKPSAVPGDTNTFMACLAAGEVSPVAWKILDKGLDDAVAIPDEAAMETMRLLADGATGDPPLVAGESGCAATAGLIAASQNASIRSALGLSAASRAIVIGSEGATDADVYRDVVGRSPAAVESQAAQKVRRS